MISFKDKSIQKKSEKKFFLFLYIFLFFAGIYTGMYCYRFNLLTDAVHHYRAFKLAPSKYLYYTFNEKANNFSEVKIDFKFKDYIKISNQRSRFVYSTNHFFRGNQWGTRKDLYVKSEIKYKGAKYKARAKLFGLNNDHYRHPYKWSFRMKMKEYVSDFRNMKFNFLRPNSRYYLSDILCNEVFKEFGILNLEYVPINLTINNRPSDIYYVEDFFSKNLIERNSYRDSYIFTFAKINHPNRDDLSEDQLRTFELMQKDLIEKPQLIMNIAKFDIFLATSFILQNKHPVLKDNFHMFYNSVSNKVEPLIRETWFDRELKIDSESDLRDQIRAFINEMKDYNAYLTTYFDQILNSNKRLDNLVESVVSVGKTMDKITSSVEWKSMKEIIYTRYPNALYISRNLMSNIRAVSNLKISPVEKRPLLSQEVWIKTDTVLDSDIILKNKVLKIAPQIKVDLNGYKIILKGGSMKAISRSNKPIVFQNNATEKSSIFIENASDTCRFENVIFKNLANLEDKYWKLPSAVTFYQSNVTIKNTIFESNRSGDDYVNFFRCSSFLVKNTNFKNVIADAIDSDFSKGSILNSSFMSIGNDAVDGSGSHITIDSSDFDGVEDKAISAGEESEIIITNSKISNSEIVFVAKDGSTIKEKNNTLLKNILDYCAFNKKKEFIHGILYSDKDIKDYSYLIEQRSKIYKNNKLVSNLVKSDSVKEKLYGVDYGKKSVRK